MLFYNDYIVYYNAYCDYFGVFIKNQDSSQLPIYVHEFIQDFEFGGGNSNVKGMPPLGGFGGMLPQKISML